MLELDFEKKILSLEQFLLIQPKIEQPLVFTNGCFDILHSGHITYLAQAKSMGKSLIVAVNSDQSVRKMKKIYDRPINSLQDRVRVLAALQSVDFVLSFDTDTPLSLISSIKPDILVKGGDWSLDKIVGADFVISQGGKVLSIPFVYNNSTTKTIQAILNQSCPIE